MRFAAEMFVIGHWAFNGTFGEEVGMWRSHDNKQAKSAHDKWNWWFGIKGPVSTGP